MPDNTKNEGRIETESDRAIEVTPAHFAVLCSLPEYKFQHGGVFVESAKEGLAADLCRVGFADYFSDEGVMYFGSTPLGRSVRKALATQHPVEDGWRDIATAPRDGTSIQLCEADPGGYYCAFTGWWADGMWRFTGQDADEDCAIFRPTHWMPLPSPPGTTPDTQVDEVRLSGSKSAIRKALPGALRDGVRYAAVFTQTEEGK